jgi:predicted DNA-binding transcriptional regulator YafY
VAVPREATLGAPVDAELLARVRDAHDAREKLRLRYLGGAQREVSERTVHPYVLVVASGRWYLVAYCESSGALRSFRLDRMEHVERLAERYEIPTTFSVEDVLQDRKVLHVGGARTMRVRYSPRVARWIAEREGREPAADGSLTMEHPLADVHWGVRHVLQYGPDAEVLEPSDVRDAVVERLRRLRTSG